MVEHLNDRIFEEIDADLHHFNDLHPGLATTTQSEYYLYNNFNDMCPADGKAFILIHYNIRSLLPKLDEIKSEISNLNCEFDIICFTESWLSESTVNLAIFEGYANYNTMRNGRRGGGISVFVKERFKCKKLTNVSYCSDHVESLFLEVKYNDDYTVLVGVLYRPPANTADLFIDKMSEILSGIRLTKYRRILICGDFNIDLLCVDDTVTIDFLNLMFSYSLIPMISKPTRITRETATLIDNIFISISAYCTAGALISDISDHLPIFLIDENIPIGSHGDSDNVKIEYRLINDYTLNKLCDNLINFDFNQIFFSNNVDTVFELFASTVYRFFNECCPVKSKTISHRSLSKPWISEELKGRVRKRQCLYLLFRQGRVARATYNRYNNFVTSSIRKAKKDYFYQRFHTYKTDAKKTWESINFILGRGRGCKDGISLIKKDGISFSLKEDIAENFNDYFSNVGNVINSSITCPSTGSFTDYLEGNFQNSFVFTPVNEFHVESVIHSLKNKQCNINVIPISVLKRISFIICPIFAKIVNFSVLSGIFPKSLKVARVVPIFKAGNEEDMRNYRPISILSVYSKIIEKLVYRQVYAFLEKYSILSDTQFGFRSGKSTTQAILHLLNYVYPSLDSGHNVLSVLCDFSKAFDSVDHSILLRKLYHYGVRSFCLDWFRSFLTGRSQHVVVSGVISDDLPLNCGVPQGSVLGPLLFLIFINDLPNSSKKLNFTLFADDSTLSYKFDPKSPLMATNTLNEELSKVYSWLVLNKIKINIEKTNYIVFSYRREIKLNRIAMGNGEISREACVKFLGVLIDQNLNFSKHIGYTKCKMSKGLGVLHKLKYFLPCSVMQTLYDSLIEPYVQYGVEVWGSEATCYLNGIYKVQKAAVRAIHGLPYATPTAEYFKKSGIFCVFKLYRYQLLQLMYKAVKQGINSDLFSSILRHSEIHSHDTRNSDNLVLPHFLMSNSQKSISYVGPKFWNEISLHAKNCTSLSIFKKVIKSSMTS